MCMGFCGSAHIPKCNARNVCGSNSKFSLTNPLGSPHVCRDKECTKNHFEHYTLDEEGEHGGAHATKEMANVCIAHHKVRGR